MMMHRSEKIMILFLIDFLILKLFSAIIAGITILLWYCGPERVKTQGDIDKRGGLPRLQKQ
jgi:hypothetical protein